MFGAVIVPAQEDQPQKSFPHVLSLNTAGSNLLLFACPDAQSLVSWVASLRLAMWEKSRLEEIYTGHILRMTFTEGAIWKNPRTTLAKGQLEGWAQVRVAGQTEWKKVWMVLSSVSQRGDPAPEDKGSTPNISKECMFADNESENQPPTTKSSATFYLSQKGKPRRRAWLTLCEIVQAYAIYPETPEMIHKSPLLKVEGLMSDEGAGNMNGREGWVLIIPEVTDAGGGWAILEMLRWIVGQCSTPIFAIFHP